MGDEFGGEDNIFGACVWASDAHQGNGRGADVCADNGKQSRKKNKLCKNAECEQC